MTSMSSLELRLDTDRIPLVLGEPLALVRSKFDGRDIKCAEDPEIRRAYLTVLGEGVELVFEDDRLATIFLYLSGAPEECGRFGGTTDMIGREILDAQDSQPFETTMERLGFVPTKRSYPFAIDRLNDDLRIRLEQRPEKSFILIDSGDGVR